MLKAILISMLLLGCRATKNSSDKELYLINATQQKLYAGAKGGGVTTEYHVMIRLGANLPFHLDSIWMDNKRFSPQILEEKTLRLIENFQMGDTLSIVFSDHISDFVIQKDADIEDPPIAYQGAALLRYFQDHQSHYLTIPVFTELPPVYAP